MLMQIIGEKPMSTRDSMAKTNKNCGAPGGSRTPNLMIRSHILYPIELRVPYIMPCTGYWMTLCACFYKVS